ncbi:aldose 1-epimerase [Devosia ginsengisoli]|uniref:aldose epimerase family protein n=1 Tax=Devosia ginsengisoli TaxID=400770 RepID=UPI0026F0722C|nr:aldose 1-epimerase [Devosia ginsengisoli]MCR6671333.1 aldose 1-epimerase [Devosia ginsengisoli]
MSPAGRLRLAQGGLEAELAPALGGRLTMLRHAGRDIVVPLPMDHADPLFWGKGGGYPLVPYHNRIANAQLHFDGAAFDLLPHPDALPHSLHGPAQRRPWRLVERDAANAVLALDYAADADWPWAFEARQSFTLGDKGLTIGLTLRNTDTTPMPAGLGWHPYLPAGRVTHDAAIHWPLRPDYLPTGKRLDGPGPQAEATRYVEAWTMAAVAVDEMDITLTASPEFGHLVVHGAGQYVCLEPATHVANGFNLAAAGHDLTGTHSLAPGEVLAGTIRLMVRETS